MKLRQRLVAVILVTVSFSFFWFVAINTTEYQLCKVDVESNNASFSQLQTNLSRLQEQKTPSEGFTKIKNLSLEEYELIRKAMTRVNATPVYARTKANRRLNFTLMRYDDDDPDSPWITFKTRISNRELYDYTPGSRVDELLEKMATLPIIRVRQKGGGTQLKLVFTLSDGSKALFKPMRFKRDVETFPDHFYFTDFERHYAEIAAFHLDRIMEFHRVPPAAGRYVNVTQDIEQLGDDELRKTVFISPAGNLCFYGKCSYYCDTGHAFCGHPDIIEGSMATYLPHMDYEADRETYANPWSRSYHKRAKAQWEEDPDYCKNTSIVPGGRKGRSLSDIVDMAIFDFLTGNLDRHHYEVFKDFKNDGYPIILDNGRAFGRSRQDDISILAPLYQCCRIRLSTLQKLLRLTQASTLLSNLMRKSLMRDRLPTLLLEPHLLALDRRALTTLGTVHDCLTQSEFDDIIVDDGY